MSGERAAPLAWRPAPARRDSLGSKLAAVGVRGLVRLAHWRGRKDAEKALRRSRTPAFRGFIQINLVRSR
ncbi:MAG: hypothetical protein JWQ97_314 [Phenylobacterium sp.]|nr:hypothetical protein [Phenylobacterium sp.]